MSVTLSSLPGKFKYSLLNAFFVLMELLRRTRHAGQKTIQVRRTRHAGHCWRSRDELIRDVLLWIPTHGRAKAGRPARTYIQQLCEDTGCCLKTYLGRWTIGRSGERGSGISVLPARYDDDDDDDIYHYIYIFFFSLYNSSILDIEHSPYYIALGSTLTHKVI